jgi:hypothetical protein
MERQRKARYNSFPIKLRIFLNDHLQCRWDLGTGCLCVLSFWKKMVQCKSNALGTTVSLSPLFFVPPLPHHWFLFCCWLLVGWWEAIVRDERGERIEETLFDFHPGSASLLQRPCPLYPLCCLEVSVQLCSEVCYLLLVPSEKSSRSLGKAVLNLSPMSWKPSPQSHSWRLAFWIQLGLDEVMRREMASVAFLLCLVVWCTPPSWCSKKVS